MFYKYESDFDNDLMFWSNCTADLWHDGMMARSERMTCLMNWLHA